MRTRFVYIIFLLAAITAAVLLVNGLRGRKVFEKKITLRKKDKIPYGTEVAYRTLPQLFPGASISSSRSMPGYWDSLSMDGEGQAYICITGNFDPDEFEMDKLISFVAKGNDVFISAFDFSYYAEQKLFCNEPLTSVSYSFRSGYKDDSLSLTLLTPEPQTWTYPGSSRSDHFIRLDTACSLVLGEENGAPNFIQRKAGKGRILIHRSPLAFSNYFILHKNNAEYFERAMSYLSPGIRRIVWDEYYLNKRPKTERSKSWFSVLMRYPGLSTAIIIGVLTLLIYALAEMRRKQRIIPPYSRPRNDSLDFVKTIGRLYFEKGDHLNLARKMTAYFLEHIRSRYKIQTGTLDDKFVTTLQYKTGLPATQIADLVQEIEALDGAGEISAQQLNRFYNKLENFYRTA